MRTRSLYHYVSVQTLAGSGTDESRAVQRLWSYKLKNVRCRIQEIAKGDADLRYGIKVSEIMYVLYFQNPQFIPDETTRYVIKNDPRQRISENDPEDGLKILEFRGKRESDLHRINRHSVVEVFSEYNKRWRI